MSSLPYPQIVQNVQLTTKPSTQQQHSHPQHHHHQQQQSHQQYQLQSAQDHTPLIQFHTDIRKSNAIYSQSIDDSLRRSNEQHAITTASTVPLNFV